MPPWPGSKLDISLIAKSRLMADSIKSPQVAVTTVIKPIPAPTTQVVSKSE